MIDTYQTDRARAILDKIGWPEWKDCRRGEMRLRLFWDAAIGRLFIHEANGVLEGDASISDHLALCLLRNHLREWLTTRGRSVGFDADAPSKIEYYVWDLRGGYTIYHDYDEALLAAAEALLAA